MSLLRRRWLVLYNKVFLVVATKLRTGAPGNMLQETVAKCRLHRGTDRKTGAGPALCHWCVAAGVRKPGCCRERRYSGPHHSSDKLDCTPLCLLGAKKNILLSASLLNTISLPFLLAQHGLVSALSPTYSRIILFA